MSRSIEDAYSACIGLCDTGWYGGILVLEDKGKEFTDVPKDMSYEGRAEHARLWSEKTLNPRREIRLVTPCVEGMGSSCIASAERLEGPVAPKEKTASPTLVWIERRAGQWHLVSLGNSEVTTVLSRGEVMRCPRAANTKHGLVFAFESDTGPYTTQVELVDDAGSVFYKSAGREPVICAAGSGFVLIYEQSSADEVTLRADYFEGVTNKPKQTIELCEGDYLLNADIAWSEQEESLFIAAESSPRWGYSNQIGLHREICLWQWTLGEEAMSLGMLPVEKRGFKTIGVENMAPIKPFVITDGDTPVVGFKQYRFTGFRGFGWDLFLCRRKGNGWSPPARISPDATTSDSDFGILILDDRYIGLFPAHENDGGNGSKMSENRRVDLVDFDKDCELERFEIPEEVRAEYRIPPECRDVAPEPPDLTDVYKGRQLIWGDLHIHSIYSKCVSAVDGSPRENIRFAREVLGCRVFAIAEHTPHTTGIESTWLYDQLESTAGQGNVILYASEPGVQRTRHLNLYSRSREVFEKLERILISQDKHYPEVIRQIREDLPDNSVFVMRHVHGDAIPDEQIPQHFDAHFEVAMEAMQGRGNAMLGEFEGSSRFPNSFLDAGCKVGLVGGTDHFREWTPNHFCLTGFWVKEVSADGVWEAIRNRYTIAMSDSRVAMTTMCKGIPMGQTVVLSDAESMTVNVQASCGHNIRRVTLMRDGQMLPWTDVSAKTVSIELADDDVTPGKHWYVVTAEVDTGHGVDNAGICHASPYFVWKKGKDE